METGFKNINFFIPVFVIYIYFAYTFLVFCGIKDLFIYLYNKPY